MYIRAAIVATALVVTAPAVSDGQTTASKFTNEQLKVTERLQNLNRNLVDLIDVVRGTPLPVLAGYLGQFLPIAQKSDSISDAFSDKYDHKKPIDTMKPIEAKWVCLSLVAYGIKSDALLMEHILAIHAGQPPSTARSELFARQVDEQKKETSQRDFECKHKLGSE